MSALKIMPKVKVKKGYRRDMVLMEVGSLMDIGSYAQKDPEGAKLFCQMR